MAREALDWAAYGTFAKDVVGHVITIAPPHKGSALANADAAFWMARCVNEVGGLLALFIVNECSQIEAGRATSGLSISSEQLAELPKFPEGITVKTIAGHATWRVCTPWGCSDKDQNGDLVVSVDSATAEYTETGVGDGKTVFECYTDIPVMVISSAWCEHSNMLQDERVQLTVVDSLYAFLASQQDQSTEFDPYGDNWWVFVDRLAIPELEQDWGGAMSEPFIASMRDYSNCPERTTAGCPSFYFTDLDAIPEELDWEIASSEDPVYTSLLQWCEVRDRDELWSLLESDVMNIGDQTAEFYTLNECSVRDSTEWDTMWVWYVPGKRVIITARNSSGGTIDMDVMEESFRQAVWL